MRTVSCGRLIQSTMVNVQKKINEIMRHDDLPGMGGS
jgi:hypothetical protein